MTPEQAKERGVKVRPLAWHVGTDISHTPMVFANTPWGQYCISYDKRDGWLIDLDGDEADVPYPNWDDDLVPYGFATELAAKRAIGASYKARILETLK